MRKSSDLYIFLWDAAAAELQSRFALLVADAMMRGARQNTDVAAAVECLRHGDSPLGLWLLGN